MTSEETFNKDDIDAVTQGKDIDGLETELPDEEDDFGSFSDASFDEFEQPTVTSNDKADIPIQVENEPIISEEVDIYLPDDIFLDENKLHNRIEILLENLFTTNTDDSVLQNNDNVYDTLLTERSKSIYGQLTLIPHLNPPNWKKSKIRRHLLISLGVPVNLDEILPKNAFSNLSIGTEGYTNKDMDYVIPSFDEYNLTEEETKEVLKVSFQEVQNIEEDIKPNLYLESLSQSELKTLNEQYKVSIRMLEEIASVWNNELESLEKDHKTYECVIDNLVGHTQRRREELKKSKSEKTKKRRSFWKK